MSEWGKASFVGPDAFQVDTDSHGETIYVGKVHNGIEVTPGKIISSQGCCYISNVGKVLRFDSYEYLKKPKNGYFTWVKASNGDIPDGAVVGGHNEVRENFYVGRIFYNNFFIPGKILRTHGCLYFEVDGTERNSKEYEVLRIVHE